MKRHASSLTPNNLLREAQLRAGESWRVQQWWWPKPDEVAPQ